MAVRLEEKKLKESQMYRTVTPLGNFKSKIHTWKVAYFRLKIKKHNLYVVNGLQLYSVLIHIFGEWEAD